MEHAPEWLLSGSKKTVTSDYADVPSGAQGIYLDLGLTPYPDLDENVGPGGLLHEIATATNKRLVFYCAYGERSAMAVQAAQAAGLTLACHVTGGLGAWKKAGCPVEGGEEG